MFEITSLAAKDTAVIPLKSAAGEPLLDAEDKPLTVTVYGPGSKPYAAAQAARQQRMLDMMASKGRNARLSPDDARKDSAKFLAACTVSFNGWSYNGVSDALAHEQAYADPALGWLADQVGQAVGDWANFSSGSAQS